MSSAACICQHFNSQGQNMCNLKYISFEEIKSSIFNNDLKVKLQRVTYLGYVKKVFKPRSNFQV